MKKTEYRDNVWNVYHKELVSAMRKYYKDTELTWYCEKTGEVVIP